MESRAMPAARAASARALRSLRTSGSDFVGGERRLGAPLLGAAAGVHQDGAAAERGAGGGHGRVPEVAADVVDDLGAGLDGEAGGFGVVGVDGEDGVGAGGEDGAEDGQYAGLLFGGGDGDGVGAGGFAAEVEDVGAFVEHCERVVEGGGGVEELAAVGEGVGRDVEDAHDERPRAEREGAGAKAPVEARADGKGHGSSWRTTKLLNPTI